MKLLSPSEMHEVFSRWQAANPKPASELDYVNAFTLLVAVVLSAQTTDKGVNKATGPLFKVADTPQKMLNLGEERIRDYIKTIGLYRNKAKNVVALSQMLITDFGGEVPQTREELMTLPNVVLSPHTGTGTWEGRIAMCENVCDNIIAFEQNDIQGMNLVL
jgi:endonuclease-3